MIHGETTGEIDQATWLGDDHDLALVTANLPAWVAAHPCHCDTEGEPCENCNPPEGA